MKISERTVVTNASSTTGSLGRKWRREEEAHDRAGWLNELRVARSDLRQYGDNPRIAERARRRVAEIEALLDPKAEVAAARAEVQRSHPDKGGTPEEFQKARRRLKAAKEAR